MTHEVLIVEDDKPSQLLLQKLLETIKGISVTAIDSGEEALELLNTKRYLLILADINLPSFSGLELAKRVRQMEKGKAEHTFIVAVTGHVDEYPKAKCTEAGIDGYMTKPVNRQKLKDFVEKLCRVVEKAGTSASG